MNIQLIHGEFNPGDAIDLLTRMINVKIQNHEQRIAQNSSEEDIKYRESKIKGLQNELHLIRKSLNTNKGNLKLNAVIEVRE
jgi:hypothetical protein